MASELKTSIGEVEFSALMEPLGPFEPNPEIAVGFSGGVDSTALLHLATRWTRRRGGKIFALTVDHGLRAESLAEAKLVQRRVKALGVTGSILRWEDHKPVSGIQNAARQARYELLTRWCRRMGVLHLLLGHHQEDQAETLLHRLGRQTGADGLTGMTRLRETNYVRLLRPCLGTPKARLRAVAESYNLEWVEDPSNQNLAYARVRLRKLLPSLEAEQISAAALAGTAHRLASVRKTLECQTAKVLAAATELSGFGYARIRLDALINVDAEIAYRVLDRLLGAIGGHLYPIRYQLLVNLLENIQESGLKVSRTLAGCIILLQNEHILIAREAGRCEEQKTIAGPWQTWDGRYRVRITGPRIPKKQIFFIRPLGSNLGQKIIGKNTKNSLIGLNPAVRKALPSIWDHRGLVCVPHLGYGRTKSNTASVIGAQIEFLPKRPVTNAFFSVV
ncbi:MAG: tRNA lysidine(34) synthetase TilS [Rhodospirillaceae bacterium]|nr:tRNA lysidine(34) synthetase TilS [Rhodospirillaceae bacterium]